jgi:hypothetical protein
MKYAHSSDFPVEAIPSGPIRLLIGAGSDAIVPIEIRTSGRPGDPYAERTRLGWVVRGPLARDRGEEESECDACFVDTMNDADQALQVGLERMWNTDFSEMHNDPR